MMVRQSVVSWKSVEHIHTRYFDLAFANSSPPQVELIFNPGCPVCVTPVGFIDEAVWLAPGKNLTIRNFEIWYECLERNDLQEQEKKGAKIRIVYSPADAEKYALNIRRTGRFLLVGFETTTPAECLLVKQAKKDELLIILPC